MQYTVFCPVGFQAVRAVNHRQQLRCELACMAQASSNSSFGSQRSGHSWLIHHASHAVGAIAPPTALLHRQEIWCYVGSSWLMLGLVFTLLYRPGKQDTLLLYSGCFTLSVQSGYAVEGAHVLSF
jgi:hypothetical protein